ncbi:MAG TPA: MMPL family transporter [Nocardioidaceae bacterium]|nr:MMPL family transporter [Nocardioidaceae bacterium]
MSSLLFRLGRFAGRHPWRVIATWVLVAVVGVMLSSSYGGETDDSFRLPGAESQRGAEAIAQRFPQQSLFTSNVVLHAKEGLDNPTARAAVTAVVDDLADDPHVVAVNDPYDRRASTLSPDGTTAFVTVGYDTEVIGVAEFEAAEDASRAARSAGIQVEYDGALGYAKGNPEPSSEAIAVAVAVVVLLVSFGSLVAMSLPILVALTGIVVGTSAISLLAGLVAVPKIANVIGLMLGLGVGIDYALFVLARHRQNLDAGMSVEKAVGRANATAGLSVLFAGLTVVVAIAGVQLSGIPMIAMMGWGAALMVSVTMVAAITLLPALLGLLGRRVNSLRVPFLKPKPANDPRSASTRWASRVVARPAPYAIAAALLLAVLTVPAFSMRLGFADAGNDAPSMTTRKAYDLMAEAYGPGVAGPMQVVLDGQGPAALDADLTAVRSALAAAPGVASVSPPQLNEDETLGVLTVVPTTSPQDVETSALLERIREKVLPAALAGSDAEAMVTGSVPIQDDVAQRLGDRMPWFIGAVIALSFIALMLLFRSVLIPLKAALLNLLSVGASYGVVVAVFQWGWAAELLGIHDRVPIMALAPMLMFAILFGLSMDYEVFLISRVREQYLVHGDARRAVVEGVGSTARVITSAALIMFSVFGAFVLGSDVTTKLFGVGLALAVLLDVTVVRMVLLPAVMSLLGERAWALPGWLDRSLPAIDIEGTEAVPETVDEPQGSRPKAAALV